MANHPIDINVGERVRARRRMLGISQIELAEHLGLSFQQIQKYEKGLNRIAPSKLVPISDVLQVPISFFFDDNKFTVGEMELITSFNKIKSSRHKESVRNIIKSLEGL